MKVKKMLGLSILILLALVIIATIVNAGIGDKLAEFTEKAKDLGQYKYVAINGALIALIALMGVSFFLTGIEEQQKKLIYVGIAVLSILLAYNVGKMPGYDGYLWQFLIVKNLLHLKVLINIFVIAAAFYFLYSWLTSETKLAEQKFATIIAVLLIVFFAGKFALSPIDEGQTYEQYDRAPHYYRYVWDRDMLARHRFWLLGDAGCTYYNFDDLGWQDDTIGINDGRNYWKGPDGEEYYEEDGKVWHYDNDYLLGWFQGDDDVSDANLQSQFKSADQLRTRQNRLNQLLKQGNAREADIERERGEVTRSKDELAKTLAIQRDSKKTYCYTEASIQEFNQQLNEKGKYTPTIKEPKYEETIGFGILRPGQLVILVIGFVIFLWMFKSLVKIEGAENKINYFLAFITAASVTHSGIGFGKFVYMMQIIAMILLYKGQNPGENFSQKIWPAVISVGIVQLIIASAMPQYALIPSLNPLTIASAGFSGILWIIIIIGVIYLLFRLVIGREVFMDTMKELTGQAAIGTTNKILESIKGGVLRKVPGVNKLNWYFRGVPNKELYSFRKLKKELIVLANYLIRQDIFSSKRNAVVQNEQPVADLERDTGGYKDFKVVKEELYACKTSGWITDPTTNEKKKLPGWYVADKYYPLINKLNEQVAKIECGMIDPDEITQFELTYDALLKEVWNDAEHSKEQYNIRFKAWQQHNKINSFVREMVDQWNPAGVYDHTYLFAEKGARWIKPTGEIDTNKRPVQKTDEFEVRHDGSLISDIHQTIDRSEFCKEGDVTPRINPAETTFLSKPKDIPKNIVAEWKGFFNDFSEGLSHKASRTVQDYVDVFIKAEKILGLETNTRYIPFKDEDVKHNKDVGKDNPAIDLQALNNDPGIFKYLGRRKIDDGAAEAVDTIPYPAISVLGLQKYLYMTIKTQMDENKVAEKMDEHLLRTDISNLQGGN